MTGKRLIMLTALALYAFALSAQKLPPKSKTLDAMQRTNQYFMNKWPDTGKDIVLHKTWPSNIWTRGVYYEGLMALYDVDPQPKYYQYAKDWAIAHQWNFRYGVKTRNADNQCAGQTYMMLYRIDKEPGYIANTKASIDSMMASHKIDDWNWIDAVQMAMPLFAQIGHTFNDYSYYERMYVMYNNTKRIEGGKGLFNTEDGLWWRDADYVPPYAEPNGEDCYWSRGNGWVLAALVRVLNEIPEDEPHRDEYINDFRIMCAALVDLQRKDGFWNASLHDPKNYGGKETTGTSLFVYGMAWGIRTGILDEKTYMPVVTKAWNALLKEAVHDNGFLGYVQSTGKEPSTGQPVTYDKQPDFEDYGLGCFLMAGSEVYKLSE